MVWSLGGRGSRGILDLVLGWIQRSVGGFSSRVLWDPNWNGEIPPGMGRSHPSMTLQTEVFGTVGGSVTFRIQDTSVTASFEDPPQALFSKQTFKKRFAVSEKGRALSISHLTLQDAGTYSVTFDGKKRFTFILHVYSKCFQCFWGILQ
uniref:Immunoglobulin subtype domain-containing protein n=1 Tax=Catharus ustulatus TaxID=91951 RepID=A0A8C3UVC3_CATUS